MDSKKMDTAEIFFVSVWNPWLRWPPWGKSRPMIRSCGFNKPVYTWKFAGDPESDCTFTPHFSGSSPKACRARFWHSVSAWSMNSLPP